MGNSDPATQTHQRPPPGGGPLMPPVAVPAQALPLLSAQQAILFVTALQGPPDDLLHLLAHTLQRLQLHATQQRVVALQDEPELGRQYRVRVAPCLVLDTGTRQIQLPGEPARLDPLRVEHALTRQ